MHHQKDHLRRDMLSNPRIYQDVLETVNAGMAPRIGMSGRRNAVYAADDFSRCMVRGAVHNGQMAGCTASERDIRNTRRPIPTDEWMRSTAAKSESGDILDSFAATVSRHSKKKRKGKLPAHEKYIGFATNRPDMDPDGYARRWGIKTGCRAMQDARAHSRSPAVRLLCFAYSVAMFNAWVMANAVLSYITGNPHRKSNSHQAAP